MVWGFNHLVLSRRAAALMQLAPVMGILQPAVLGNGIHGGPAAMQKVVEHIFRVLRDDDINSWWKAL